MHSGVCCDCGSSSPSSVVLLLVLTTFIGLGLLVGVAVLVLLWPHHKPSSLSSSSSSSSSSFHVKQLRDNVYGNKNTQDVVTQRILYIITSSVEFDRRHSQDGLPPTSRDRLMDVLVPVVKAGIDSILQSSSSSSSSSKSTGEQRQQQQPQQQYQFSVDVYLVLGYQLSPNRKQHLRSMLPRHVGLEIWDDAAPLYYEFSATTSKSSTNRRRVPYLSPMSRTLARQHRHVVKDKLPYYNIILAMEDDMLVTKHHILYHLQFRYEQNVWIQQLQQHLQQQQQQQQQSFTKMAPTMSSSTNNWWDNLSMDQWKRLYPAWIRVEMVPNSTAFIINEPNEYKSNVTAAAAAAGGGAVDVGSVVEDEALSEALTMCCRDFVQKDSQTTNDPMIHTNGNGNGTTKSSSILSSDQLVVWETGIAGLSVRRLPPQPSTTPTAGSSLRLGFWDATFGKWSSSSSSSSFVQNGYNNNTTTILKPSTWIVLIDPASAVDASTVPQTTTSNNNIEVGGSGNAGSNRRRHRRTLTGYWSGSYGRLLDLDNNTRHDDEEEATGTTRGRTTQKQNRYYYYDKPPSARENHFFANPAGWIGTVQQILDWHVDICPSNTFLPPFGSRSILSSASSNHGGVGAISTMVEDGMDFNTDYVEYWSGGMQLFGQSICAVQRVVSIDRFYQHFIYHTANNKQHDLPIDRFVTSTTLWHQLQDVRIHAENDFQKYRRLP